MTAPDHEEDEEIEDPEVDEQMDTSVRTTPQQPDEDETSKDNPYGEAADVLDDEET